MNVIIIIVALVGGLAGALSTVYLTVSLPAVLVWKLYRRVCHGISVMD